MTTETNAILEQKDENLKLKRDLKKLAKIEKYKSNATHLNDVINQYKKRGFEFQLEQIKDLFHKSVLTEERYDSIVKETGGKKTEIKRIKKDMKFVDNLSEIIQERYIYGASQLKVKEADLPIEKMVKLPKIKEVYKNISLTRRYISSLKETMKSLDFASIATTQDDSINITTDKTNLISPTNASVHFNLFKNDSDKESFFVPKKHTSKGNLLRKKKFNTKGKEELNIGDLVVRQKGNYYNYRFAMPEDARKAYLLDIVGKANSRTLAEGELESDIKTYFRKLNPDSDRRLEEPSYIK